MWQQLTEQEPDRWLEEIEAVAEEKDLDPQEVDGSKDGDDSVNA